MKCPACGNEVTYRPHTRGQRLTQRRRIVWITVAALASFALALLVWRSRGHILSAFHWSVEAMGSTTAALFTIGLGLFALACALLWMLLPVIVYLGFRALQRRMISPEHACADLYAAAPSKRGEGEKR